MDILDSVASLRYPEVATKNPVIARSFELHRYQVFREVPNSNQRQSTARRTQGFPIQYKSAWTSRQGRQKSKQSTTSYLLLTREFNKPNVSNPAQIGENPVQKIRIPPKQCRRNQDSPPKCSFEITSRFRIGKQLLFQSTKNSILRRRHNCNQIIRVQLCSPARIRSSQHKHDAVRK
jgi:hypothetical protein